MHRNIGTLSVSVLGIGCNNMGRGLDELGTKNIVDAALDNGINFFDTADKYGETRSELFLGKALGDRRDKVIVATKFGLTLPDNPRSGGGSARWTKSAIKDSLNRLGTEYVDLYQIHRPDPTVPMEETLEALTELVQQGLVREVGISNVTLEILENAHEISTERGFVQLRSVQNEYSMIRREVEQNGILKFCEQTGTAFVPYYPLASGLLTGKYRHGQQDPEDTRLATIKLYQDWFSDDDRSLAKDIVEEVLKLGLDPLASAIQWILRQQSVATVITGASRPEQVTANAQAVSVPMPQEDLEAISAIIAKSSS